MQTLAQASFHTVSKSSFKRENLSSHSLLSLAGEKKRKAEKCLKENLIELRKRNVRNSSDIDRLKTFGRSRFARNDCKTMISDKTRQVQVIYLFDRVWKEARFVKWTMEKMVGNRCECDSFRHPPIFIPFYPIHRERKEKHLPSLFSKDRIATFDCSNVDYNTISNVTRKVSIRFYPRLRNVLSCASLQTCTRIRSSFQIRRSFRSLFFFSPPFFWKESVASTKKRGGPLKESDEFYPREWGGARRRMKDKNERWFVRDLWRIFSSRILVCEHDV